MKARQPTPRPSEQNDVIYRLTFEIRSVGSTANVLTSGERMHAISDVQVEERQSADGTQFWSKTLALTSGWAIGAHISRGSPEEGFGIYARGPSDSRSFSWNWFAPECERVYRHIRCGARVNATFRQVGTVSELARLDFMDDTTVTFKADATNASHHHSHEVLILKGSTLCLSL
jgi:hypothetical protein